MLSQWDNDFPTWHYASYIIGKAPQSQQSVRETAMKILMIAPVPFVEPRGAVFQVYDRLRALSQLGHQVDLVTYPIGQDASLPGLRIQRAWRYPGLSRIKVSPSAAKFPLDALLFLRALLLLLTHPRRYDVIHTHLEAGFFGAILGWLFRLP